MEVLVGLTFNIDVPTDRNSKDQIFLNRSPENDHSNIQISGLPKFFVGDELEIGSPDDSDNKKE